MTKMAREVVGISKEVIAYGGPVTFGCDARCDRAWGINSRPRVALDPEDPDDYCFMSDEELGLAPIDPGTYEGGDAKPRCPQDRLNRWCFRECERSARAKADGSLTLQDWSQRVYNQPSKHGSKETIHVSESYWREYDGK